jgi:hypothetical protein
MHEANQPLALHPFIKAFQWLLLNTPVGRMLVQVRLGGRRHWWRHWVQGPG